MAEKLIKSAVSDMRPVPMKLFATWEIEKSAPYCIPRLCSLTLSKLDILKPLETEMHSVILAVKMQNSKKVLRSNEIVVTSGVALDIELELSFSLQYPHLLKRDGNRLQVMLQRRKKYKNRTILGYKTLAIGQINMSQVLQRCMDTELDLYSDGKDQVEPVARVAMLSLMSQPVDHDESSSKKRTIAGDLSEEEDGNEEYSSNEELSDSDPNAVDDETCGRSKRFPKEPFRSNATRHQGNIKQKFIALLRRFKITDDVLDGEQDPDESCGAQNPHDIEYLFDELENLSESDPDADTISVVSTPKPKLRLPQILF